MFHSDYITKEEIKEQNPNWPKTPIENSYSCRFQIWKNKSNKS